MGKSFDHLSIFWNSKVEKKQKCENYKMITMNCQK